MLPLIPLALSLAPELAKWLFGDSAEKTATAVASVVADVTGTTDVAAASAAVARDPDLATKVRVELAKIAADAEAAARASDLATLQSSLADLSSARAQTVALAQAHSPIAYAPVVVTVTVMAVFFGLMVVAFYKPMPAGSEDVLKIVLGTLSAAFTGVVGYWVGSSRGSDEKTRMLYASTPAAPALPPPAS